MKDTQKAIIYMHTRPLEEAHVWENRIRCSWQRLTEEERVGVQEHLTKHGFAPILESLVRKESATHDKKYTDIDGNKHDLPNMCRVSPEWAASNISRLNQELYLALLRIPERTEAEELRMEKLWHMFSEDERTWIGVQLRGDRMLPMRREPT